ncbi:sensor histidine kinase [Paenibacillus aceris]|uniref:histidine kinase n=1 Tax=Paenibacillus aceris TaxID=869555 RepID=A0ABS4HT90_9BACL|nr:HAMP domain-containing sensor histidine kinase [Paenibacillus aceris]MBP1961846.1 signal transduction histidine kinase [Paenibacillus aceris]NHW34297.1 HAMP domain-containing histidine kinase [Paenibacillus aceris]
MFKRWLAGKYNSLYLKIFLSFLATCVLFFVGLFLFWNYYFTDLFYKGKVELLEKRVVEVTRLMNSVQDGSISTRELKYTIRILARSINGQVWLVDDKGNIQNGSSDSEGRTIPKQMDAQFIDGLHGHSGYGMVTITTPDGRNINLFTYHAPYQLNGQPMVIVLHFPAGDISEAISAVRVNILVPLLFSLLAVGFILYIISRKLAGPLQQMNRAALELAHGDFTTRVPITSHDEVGQLAASFNFMVEQLEEWEGTRQEFLTNVSHELRSPLTTLRGFIVAMNDRIIPEEKYSHYLRICDQEVQRLQRLVTDLLDLAQIQNGVDVFRLRPVIISEALEESLELLKAPIAVNEITLHLILPNPEKEPAQVPLDPDRFAQIVHNLIYNSLKFTPKGGTLTVALEEAEHEVHLYIRDTGTGMTEAELARIWDRFYKADEARTSRSDVPTGTGLGLTIVKHLVTGMQGTIQARSRLGEGTEFRVTFPRIS